MAGAPKRSFTKDRVLVSDVGHGTLQLVEVTDDGKLKSQGKAQVGKAPKRVAFLPASAPVEGKGP